MLRGLSRIITRASNPSRGRLTSGTIIRHATASRASSTSSSTSAAREPKREPGQADEAEAEAEAAPVMKAVWLDSFASTALEAMRVDTSCPLPPAPKHNEVMVRVRATSINPLDVRMMEGYGRKLLGCSRDLPVVLGRDVAGEVCEVGAGVWDLKVGHRVWGALSPSRSGAFREYALLHANEVGRMPASLTFEQAASFPFVAITAYQALKPLLARGSLAGCRVFIHGGSGPLGRLAVQLLKHLGCSVGVSCSGKNARAMRDLGCDVVVDYQHHYFSDRLAEVWSDGIDFFLDNVGVAADHCVEDQALALLTQRKGGYACTLGAILRRTDDAGVAMGLIQSCGELTEKKHRFAQQGATYDWVLADPMSAQTDAILRYIGGLVEEGVIRPHLHPVTFRGAEGILEAMECEQQHLGRGKVVVAL